MLTKLKKNSTKILSVVGVASFIALAGFLYNIPLFEVLYIVVLSLLGAYVVLYFIYTVWRKRGVNLIFYKFEVVLLALGIFLLFNWLFSSTFKYVHSFVDTFVYVSIHPVAVVAALVVVWLFVTAVYTRTLSLQKIEKYLPFVVFVIDVLGVIGYLLFTYLLKDFSVEGVRILSYFVANAKVLLTSKLAVFSVWGDMGTFVLAHTVALFVLLRSFRVTTLRSLVKDRIVAFLIVENLVALAYAVVFSPSAFVYLVAVTVVILVLLILSKGLKAVLDLRLLLVAALSLAALLVMMYVFTPVAYVPAVKALVTGLASGSWKVFVSWLSGYDFVRGAFVGLVPSAAAFYLMGMGAFHSGLLRPLIVTRAAITSVYSPVVDLLFEFGFIGLLLGLGVVAALVYLWFKHDSLKDLSAIVLLAISVLFVLFFYPTLVAWVLLFLAAFYIFEKYSPHYNGFVRLGVYSLGLKKSLNNVTPKIVGFIGVVIVAMVVYAQASLLHLAYRASRTFVRQSHFLVTAQQKGIEELNKVSASLFRENYVLHKSCGNCSFYYVVQADTLTKILEAYNAYLANNPNAAKNLDLPLEEYMYALVSSLGYLENTHPAGNIYGILGRGFNVLTALTNSDLYRQRALEFYGRYLVFNPADVQAARAYANLIVSVVDATNVAVYEPRFAAVVQILEAAALNDLKAGNLASLVDVVHLKAAYLLKLKRYEEAKKLYKDLLRILNNVKLEEKTKKTIIENINKIIDGIEKLQQQVGGSTEQTSEAAEPVGR